MQPSSDHRHRGGPVRCRAAGPARLAWLALLLAAAPRAQNTGPAIVPWYGDLQVFGRIGTPQKWVNVLGNVADPDGVQSLSCSLNGGPDRLLSIGPDLRRLARAGDFNIDIHRLDLLEGLNTLSIRATDSLGNKSTKVVVIDFTARNVWPATFTVDWTLAQKPEELAQIVDGEWALDPGGVRPVSLGYDRILVVGDETWTDYEVTVPITVHAIDGSAFGTPSGGPGIGFSARWLGHTQMRPGEQPFTFWLPQGGGPWYGFTRSGSGSLSLDGFDGMSVPDPSGLRLQLDRCYVWKLRAENLPGGDTWYGFKLWERDLTEPVDWLISGTEGLYDLKNGSLVVVAHHVDATFGEIDVKALADDTDPPAMLGVTVIPDPTGARVSWRTTEPASSRVEFGRSAGYEIGSVWQQRLVTDHALVVSGLAAGTVHHFRIGSRDGRGNEAFTGDGTFTTLLPGAGGGHGIPPSSFASDEFDGPALDPGVWAVFDPFGDTTIRLNGTQLSIVGGTDPSGVVRTLTMPLEPEPGDYVFDPPRAMRAVPDGDFEFEVKMDSALPTDFLAQGILVEDGPTDYLRIEFNRSFGRTRLLAASKGASLENVHLNRVLTGLAAPMFLRLRRVGDHFMVEYSRDGSVWIDAVRFDLALSVRSAGVYASNSSGKMHNALFDYFRVHDLSGGGAGNAGSVPVSTLRSDEFDAPNLDPQTWAFFTPYRSGRAIATGAAVEIEAPAGIDHDAASGGILVPRIVRALPPGGAFDVAVKFDSDPAGGVRRQGILFEKGPRDFVRVDFRSDGAGTSLHAAVFADDDVTRFADRAITGTAPMFVRVRRQGTAWTVFCSSDGTTWTTEAAFETAVLPAAVALFAGSGARDSHTARADWFHVGDPGITPSGTPLSALAGDEFDAPALNQTVWSFKNPLGDGSVRATGERVEIVAPAGNTHGIGPLGIDAPRIMRSARDQDMELEVKLDSILGATAQAHGLLVEQDSSHFLRVGFDAVDNELRLVAESVIGPTATRHADLRLPLTEASTRLRLRRNGHLWEVRWSTGGGPWRTATAFGQILLVTEVGIYASNGQGVGHTAVVDYFRINDPHAGPNGVPRSQLASDEFDSTVLDPSVWAFLDPLGDGSVSLDGSHLRISVPATRGHFGWSNGNTMPRVMRAAPDQDFKVQAKFDSGLPPGYAGQGILVEHSEHDFLRFEIYALANQTYALVAGLSDGIPAVHANVPVTPAPSTWLRVTHQGPVWTLARSTDGTAWTDIKSVWQPMSGATIGLYAANAVGSAHTASVDSFRLVP